MPNASKTSTTTAAKPATTASKAASTSKTGTKIGVVESDKRHKTRTVVVSYAAKHPKYGKYIGQRTVLQVHDETNDAKTGDIVEVSPCRPLSKTKSWKLVRVVERRSDVAAALASAKEIK